MTSALHARGFGDDSTLRLNIAAYMRTIVLCITIALLVACAPVRESYYKPIGSGDIYGLLCSGPRNHMGFEVTDGLGIMVSAWKYDQEKIGSVWIEFYVGAGHILQFVVPFTSITTIHDYATYKYKLEKVTYDEYLADQTPAVKITHEFSPSDQLHGATDSRFSPFLTKFQTYRSYLTKVEIGGLAAKSFIVQFPEIILDGKRVEISNIRFEYRDEKIWVGLMC